MSWPTYPGGRGSSGLGVFTWAGLQTDYPNGGGALAALPAGVTATVTGAAQAPLTMTPNAAKTRWIPLNGVAILWQYSGSFATPLWTQVGATGLWSPPGGAMTSPAGLFAAGDHFSIDWTPSRGGSAANLFYAIRFGTAGGTADARMVDTYLTTTVGQVIYGKGETSFATATRVVTTNFFPIPNNLVSGGNIVDETTNINAASAMTWTVDVVTINAADTFYLHRLSILWKASA
jgi:hypothetical protein